MIEIESVAQEIRLALENDPATGLDAELSLIDRLFNQGIDEVLDDCAASPLPTPPKTPPPPPAGGSLAAALERHDYGQWQATTHKNKSSTSSVETETTAPITEIYTSLSARSALSYVSSICDESARDIFAKQQQTETYKPSTGNQSNGNPHESFAQTVQESSRDFACDIDDCIRLAEGTVPRIQVKREKLCVVNEPPVQEEEDDDGPSMSGTASVKSIPVVKEELRGLMELLEQKNVERKLKERLRRASIHSGVSIKLDPDVLKSQGNCEEKQGMSIDNYVEEDCRGNRSTTDFVTTSKSQEHVYERNDSAVESYYLSPEQKVVDEPPLFFPSFYEFEDDETKRQKSAKKGAFSRILRKKARAGKKDYVKTAAGLTCDRI